MDWLGVKFCVLIWVLYISQLQAIPPENEDLRCVEGQIIPPPDECNTCICFDGEIHCTHVECSPKNATGAEPKCVSGERIQRPDECNACICFEGEIHCSNKPCNRTSRIGPVCDDNQPVYRPDECNECYCFKGRLECSDLVCIRGSKCVPGQEIPQPDSCNVCKCHDGYILCTNHECSTAELETASTEVQPLAQCEEGDYIPPPPPPDDCNTCLCVNSRVLCTMETCPKHIPDLNGRFKEEHNSNYLQSFDKPISVQPFINMFSKNGDKTPTKLIHTHAYNGYHQEIKVHTKHLPKDKAKLLNALANSLNNPTLADISDNIRETSLNSPHNNPVQLEEDRLPVAPLAEGNVVPNNSLDSPEVHLTHSSKLITSGSQSNETILVIPESIDNQNTKTVLPIQHETHWDTLPTPNPQIHKNTYQIIPYSSEEETFLEYYSENPPSYISSIDEYKIIRNPAKFGRPGQQNIRPLNPTRNTVDVSDQYNESVVPSNPHPTHINDEISSYEPFQQDKIITNPYELQPLHPDELAGPVDVYKFNDTSSHPVYTPDEKQYITDLNIKGSPHQPQLEPHSNQFYPPQYEDRYQKPQLLNSNKKSSMANPFEMKQNQTTPQSGSTPNQDSLKLTSYPKTNKYYLTVPNKGFKPDQEYRFSDNEGITQIPPYDKIKPNPTEYRSDELFPTISEFVLDNQDTSDTVLHIPQQKPIHSQYKLKPGLTHYGPNKQFSPKNTHMYDENQHEPGFSKFEPHSLYYNHPHTLSKVELKPKHEKLKPAPTSYNYLQEYNSPQTALEHDHEKPVTITHKGGSRYKTTPSHYDTTPKIIYGSEYNPHKPGHKHIPQHDSPYQFDFYPGEEQNESDSTMAKVYQYLNPQSHTKFDPKQRKNQTSMPKLSQLSKYHPPGLEGQSQYDNYNTPINNYPHIDDQIKPNHNPKMVTDHSYNPIVPQFKPKYPQYKIPQSHSKPGDFNEQGFQNKPYTAENPTNTKNSQQKPALHQFKPYDQPNLSGPVEDPGLSKINSQMPRPSKSQPIQTQPDPNYYYDHGSVDQFLHKPHFAGDFAPSKFRLPPDQPKSKLSDNHANGFPYTSHSGEDPTKTKLNQFKPRQPQHIFPNNPGIFDDRGSPDGFQYISHSEEDPLKAKVNKFKPPQSAHIFPQNHQNPGPLDRGSTDKYQHTLHSVEDPLNAKVNKFKPPQLPHIFHQNPGPFDDRSSADGFQYTPHSGENPPNAKVNQFKPPQSQHIFPQNHKNPGTFDDRGSADGFQYKSHSDEDPTKTKVHQLKPSQSQHIFPQNHQSPGTLDDRGSADGFQYISNSGEDPSNAKVNQFEPPQPQHKFPQNHKNPGPFDDRGSADGFKYTSHPGEDPSNTKLNPFKPSQSQPIFPQNHQNPGTFDDRGSADGFQYTSHPGEDPLNAKVNQFKLPQSQPIFPQNHQSPGPFDDRGPTDRFQYTPHPGEDPSNAKVNQFKPPQSQPILPQNHQNPGPFDDRGSADGFQYTPHAGEDPSNAKVNPFKPLQSQPIFPQNHQNPRPFDDRDSADGFQYTPHPGEDPSNAKVNQFKPLQSQPILPQNHQNPGPFDDRGSADRFQYTSLPGEDPSNAKVNQFKPPQSQPIFPQNHQNPGTFDDRGAVDGFQYISHSGEDPSNGKVNQFKPPQSQPIFPQNHQNPGTFDDRGAVDGFQYISHSGEDPSNGKVNQFKPPRSQPIFPQNHQNPGTFDDRGAIDGFQYISHSGEDPKNTKGNHFKSPNHKLPAEGYPFKYDSAKINKPEKKSTLFKTKPYDFDPWNLYNHKKPKIKSGDVSVSPSLEKSSPFKPKQYGFNPWKLFKPDHDQYKPSLIDSILNGARNIPWILYKPKDSTKRPSYKPQKDQYKPSSADNLFNGVHEIPRPDNTNSDSPKTPFKPDKSQNKPSVLTDSSWPKQNQTLANNNVAFQPKQDNISSSVMNVLDSDSDEYDQFPYHPKSNKNNNSSLSLGNPKVSYATDRYSPLLKAIKNYIDLTSNDDPGDDNDFDVGATDHMNFLPILIPNLPIFKNKTNIPSPDQDESTEVDKSLDFSDSPTINDQETLKMVKGKQKKKRYPSKPNGTNNNKQPDKLSQQDIEEEIAKIFSIPQTELETTTVINDNCKKNQPVQTTTQLPVTESTDHYQNPQNEKDPEKNQHVPLLQFPIIHIILHQPNMVAAGRPEFLENGVNQASDINPEDLSSSFPQEHFKHRPKDKKEECADGTEWTNNCHACSCHDGFATCIEIPDCKMRPFGEPMICKPYSSFKMGNCYSCECNGDGVAECSASDCNEDEQENDDSYDIGLPVYYEFFDDQKAHDLIQYFSFYKKLPKVCPKKRVYPTCEAGTRWVSSCYKCECDEHGKHHCSPIEDCELDLDSYGKASRCKPNTKFYPKTTGLPCVECYCNDEGTPFCPTIDYRRH